MNSKSDKNIKELFDYAVDAYINMRNDLIQLHEDAQEMTRDGIIAEIEHIYNKYIGRFPNK